MLQDGRYDDVCAGIRAVEEVGICVHEDDGANNATAPLSALHLNMLVNRAVKILTAIVKK